MVDGVGHSIVGHCTLSKRVRIHARETVELVTFNSKSRVGKLRRCRIDNENKENHSWNGESKREAKKEWQKNEMKDTV